MKRFYSVATVCVALAGFGLTGCSHISSEVAKLAPSATKSKNNEVKLSMAKIHERRGNLDEAIKLYAELLESAPGNVKYCHRLAVVNARKGDHIAASQYFQKAQKLSPHDSDLLTDYGYELYLQDDFVEAERVLKQALRSKPNNQRAINNLALVYGEQGRINDSFTLFRQVLTEAEANANVAYIHVQRGEGDKAIKRYSRALSLDSNLKSASNALLQIAEMQKSFDPLQQRDVLNSKPQEMIASAPVRPEPQPAEKIEEIVQVKAVTTPEINREKVIIQEEQISTTVIPVAQQSVIPVIQPSQQIEQVNPFRNSLALQEAETRTPLISIEPAITANAPANATVEIEQASAADVPFRQLPLDEPVVSEIVDDQSASELVSEQEETEPLSAMVQLCPQAEGAVLELVKALDTDDATQLKRAIHRLGRNAEEAQAASPALRTMLNHDDFYVRIHCALALWRIDQDAETAIPILIDSLSQDEPGVRSFAAAVLGEIGPQSTDAIPALNQALADGDGYVRLHVAEALGRFENWQDKASDVLLECLTDSDENVRWLSTYSLADLAPESEKVVTALASSLLDQQPRVRAGAAFALGEIGPAAQSAVTGLKKAQDDDNEDVRTAAEHALNRIQQ
jgi:HEAT repeat protein/Flp pilus assembly protein TadD